MTQASQGQLSWHSVFWHITILLHFQMFAMPSLVLIKKTVEYGTHFVNVKQKNGWLIVFRHLIVVKIPVF